jgi:putative transposase
MSDRSLLSPKDKKYATRAAVYDGWFRRNPLDTVGAVYLKLSRQHGVSVSTVQRYIKDVEENGYRPLRERKERPLVAWDQVAIDFFKSFLLVATKEVGRCTVRNAYRHTVDKARREGWRVGSEQSAYVHAQAIHAALKMYARGGDRALDNMFYIARDLSGLRPFQIVVGDQHRFDFWVTDTDGRVFRPECYLWLDMRTRLVYGIAFDRSYNTHTVLRALKMGVTRFGKFESTYNDNGSSEPSEVADYVIDQLQLYGMAFRDESELYKTESGRYIVEDTTGKMLDIAQSRTEWRKRNRRIFAAVKNAKTKPIERFFSTLEQLLMDMCLPGYVKELGAPAPEEEESERRLSWQRRNGYILPFDEFVYKVVEALDIYENREHGTLGRSPRSEMQYAIECEGFSQTFIKEEDVHYLFLERAFAVVRGDRVRLFGKDFIGPDLTSDMVRSNRNNLVGLNRRKVELRYNPDDIDSGIWAIDPRDHKAIFLRPVERIAMLDGAAAEKAVGWKRRNMQAVRGAFHSSASGIKVLSEPEKFRELNESRCIAYQGDAPDSLGNFGIDSGADAVSDEAFNALVSAKITVEPSIKERSRPVFTTEQGRYEYLLEAVMSGKTVSAQDVAFMSGFESTMTDDVAEYYESFKRFNKR